MKEKKDCKECGAPLKDWQVKQGYELCLECYKSKRKTSHEILKEKAIEEDGAKEIKNESEEKEFKEETEEEALVEENLGEDSGHLENHLQGEEE
jgi:uncharacterized Zn finger protein (UPF0148 family)